MSTHPDLTELWAHVQRGRSAAVIGAESAALPASWSPLVVRVRCDRAQGPLYPVLEARRTIQRLLGDAIEETNDPSAMGLRRRLLGELPSAGAGEKLIDACNRLHREAQRGAVLIFEAAETMDPSAASLLRQCIAGPNAMTLPVVLAFRSAPSGAPAMLLDALERAGGLVTTVEPPPTASIPASGTRNWQELPAGALRVLRTAAVLGPECDAAEIAELLGLEPIDVLELLQSAADAGVPVEDRGDMRFHLPASLVEELRASVLPSLARARQSQARAAASRQEAARAIAAPAVGDDFDDLADEGAPRWVVPAQASEDTTERGAPAVPARGRSARTPPPDDPEALVARHLAEARRAEELGSPGRAIEAARAALATLERTPESRVQRQLRAWVLCEMGRIQWMGAGPEYDFSLAGALDALTASARLLGDDDPIELRARIATVMANVLYDVGDPRSLHRALEHLTAAARMLRAAGDVRGAARLLNDQAAVQVRLGETRRAVELLEEARAAFSQHAEIDPVAMAEIAETEHLLARIPLHAEVGMGEDPLALERALASARAAEAVLQHLHATRDLARVWETMGRLELLRGDIDRAIDHLQRAARAQQAGSDAVGLARTAAALAEALEAAGDHRRALTMLGDSVRLNLAKGSPLGLAFNRKSLEALAAGQMPDAESEELVREVSRGLTDAEQRVGRVPLPGSSWAGERRRVGPFTTREAQR